MAQIRDAQTSQILAEGTPLEVALAARALGTKEILFDGVGESFDPDAVITAHEESMAGLEGLAAEAEGDEAKNLRKALKQRQQEGDVGGFVDEAAAALEAARAALDEAAG